jgi:hypothetical protein
VVGICLLRHETFAQKLQGRRVHEGLTERSVRHAGATHCDEASPEDIEESE